MPPSNNRFAANVSFLSHARYAWAACCCVKPSATNRFTAAISSSVSRITPGGSAPPPGAAPPRPAAPPPICAIIASICPGGRDCIICSSPSSCSGAIPNDCAKAARCGAGRAAIICIICAGSGMPPAPGGGRPAMPGIGGTPAAAAALAPAAAAGAGAGGGGVSLMGSFIIAMKASLFAWMAASSSGLCWPIRSSTCDSAAGLLCTSCFSMLNCGCRRSDSIDTLPPAAAPSPSPAAAEAVVAAGVNVAAVEAGAAAAPPAPEDTAAAAAAPGGMPVSRNS
mmetsp:Transcript_5377/g.8803  ORF Transcript_5377/g.8803 Transcript_5377/m.8803 type:complete len:281 (+) Transcript_5377:374-1216(+)